MIRASAPVLLLALVGLGGCHAPIVPPSLSMAGNSPDGKVQLLADGTDPDDGRPEHLLYLRTDADQENGVPVLALDDIGDWTGSFTYSHEWTGPRRLSIWTRESRPSETKVHLTNGDVVTVIVRPPSER